MAIYLRPAVRADLRRRYEKLKVISVRRWSTLEGQAFLRDLTAAQQRYGQLQLAEALGVSRQSISRMIARHDPSVAGAAIETERALSALRGAYQGVQRWRALNRTVRRDHASWQRMHDAIGALASRYPIPVIARLSGIRAQELYRFMAEPEPTVRDDLQLLLLLDEYDGGRALSSPRCRAFLTLLEETLASHPLAEVASVLRVKPALVRTWMVEKTHGQCPS